MRNLFKSKDKKPVLLSFILQRDDCSRLLGEFGEQHLPECSKLILVWQNGDDTVKCVHSDSVDREVVARLLVKATLLVGGCVHE